VSENPLPLGRGFFYYRDMDWLTDFFKWLFSGELLYYLGWKTLALLVVLFGSAYVVWRMFPDSPFR